jgi:hypothetical protein
MPEMRVLHEDLQTVICDIVASATRRGPAAIGNDERFADPDLSWSQDLQRIVSVVKALPPRISRDELEYEVSIALAHCRNERIRCMDPNVLIVGTSKFVADPSNFDLL